MKILPRSQKKYFYSPLRYPGGKSSLTTFFDEIIKNNKFEDFIYVEPFAGGAGSALSLLLQEKVGKIIINDLDPAIYSFWKAVIYDSFKFVERIKSVKVDIKEWCRQKEIYKKKKLGFDLGFATFFLNRTNRSGIVEGGPIGGMNQKSKWKINVRFNKKGLIDRIQKISKYQDRITVTNEDGLDMLKKIKKIKKIFVYLDPPYYEKGSSLYLNSYNQKDHKKLADFLNKDASFNWLLTYDNVDEIKKIYNNLRKEEFSLNYSAYKKIKGSELMIFSDSLII